MNTLKAGLAAKTLSSINRITPVRPLGMVASRGFSTQVDTDDSDLELEDDGMTKKGRFFKFLEKAENLDEKIKESPDEAKKVFTGEEEPVEILFDADEIEISLSDKSTERSISDELAAT